MAKVLATPPSIVKVKIVDSEGYPTKAFIDLLQGMNKRLNDPGVGQLYVENGDLVWNDATQTPHVIVVA
jgi:hypothetical protein